MYFTSIFVVQNGAVLFASAAWLTMHRVLLNRGFLIKRRGLSTDSLYSIVIGITASVWTVAIVLSGEHSGKTSQNTSYVLEKAAQAPLLLQTLFAFWLMAWCDGIRSVRLDNLTSHFWNLSASTGPFDWSSSVTSSFYLGLCMTLTLSIVVSSISSIALGSFVTGVLNLISLAVFIVSGTGPNPYVKAPHRYSGDMLRIALPTSHHEGTIYILPCAGFGMDAVWSPKVYNEHLEADEQAMALFQSMRSGRWSLQEPLERIRHIVASYHKRTALTPIQIENLARWLYLEDLEDGINMRSIRCQRAPKVHLIGRDLMYALCHAEYLVFMGQGRLPLDIQEKLGMLRLMKRSGGTQIGSGEVKTIGFESGFEGYKEAVQYVYKLFDEPLDASALNFEDSHPPSYSTALSKTPASIAEYVADLWDACCEHNESTFTALYMFTAVWFIEIGNANGFHIFPLRCRSRNGDLISKQIVWRQAWYCGVMAQLIAASPILFGAFVSGYMQ